MDTLFNVGGVLLLVLAVALLALGRARRAARRARVQELLNGPITEAEWAAAHEFNMRTDPEYRAEHEADSPLPCTRTGPTDTAR